jgi:Kef-type K+ transport system membrane component KefB
MRSIAFTMLTPFFFIKAGTLVSLSALLAGLGLIVVLLGVKIATKFVGVWPLTRAFGVSIRDGHYTTLGGRTAFLWGMTRRGKAR